MIDRTSRYTLLKYFSDGCTAIYLSHRFSSGQREGGGRARKGGRGTRDKKRLRLISRHLRESHPVLHGSPVYIGRVSIVTKSAGTTPGRTNDELTGKRIGLPAVRPGDS